MPNYLCTYVGRKVNSKMSSIVQNWAITRRQYNTREIKERKRFLVSLQNNYYIVIIL